MDNLDVDLVASNWRLTEENYRLQYKGMSASCRRSAPLGPSHHERTNTERTSTAVGGFALPRRGGFRRRGGQKFRSSFRQGSNLDVHTLPFLPRWGTLGSGLKLYENLIAYRGGRRVRGRSKTPYDGISRQVIENEETRTQSGSYQAPDFRRWF